MTTTMPIEKEPFQTSASLRAEHLALLESFQDAGEPAGYAPEIKEFIRRGSASGVYIDLEADRRSAQSVLDYWSTRLYRLTSEDIKSSLQKFDPSLAPELADELCPYVGLDAFVEEKRDVFFGRERLAADLAQRLEQERILIVVGSSGSGKSSLVRAGLLPAMKRAAFPAEEWTYLGPMVPGADPNETLADLLAGHEGQPLVLTIDQFEEVFTLTSGDEEIQPFVAKLLEMSQDEQLQHRIVLTVRTDFITQMTSLPELYKLNYVFHVPPLSSAELRDAIQAPADRIGLKFDEGIVDALLNEILGEPAALPLLQFTLLRLWENREHNRITWTAYKRLGGGRKALENSATEFYNGLIREQQDTAREILLRLVQPGEGLEITSRRVQRKELHSMGYAVDRVEAVLGKFIDAHLLRVTPGKTREQDQVEVAHEALIRNWPSLIEWLEKEREKLRERRRLRDSAELWQQHGRDASLLLRGVLLDEAEKYKDLSTSEAAFMQASLAVRREEEEAKKAAEKRLAQIAASGMIIAGSFAAITVGLIMALTSISGSGLESVGFVLAGLGFFAAIVMSLRIGYLSLLSVLPARTPIQKGQAQAVAGASEGSWLSNLLAAVFYLFVPVTFVAMLFARKKLSRFARFHALQSMTMFLVTLVLVLWSSLDSSGLGLVSALLLLASYILIIVLAVQAGRGRYTAIPLLGRSILKFLDRKA